MGENNIQYQVISTLLEIVLFLKEKDYKLAQIDFTLTTYLLIIISSQLMKIQWNNGSQLIGR